MRLDDLVEARQAAQEALIKAQDEFDDADRAVTAFMKSEQMKTSDVTVSGKDFKVTLIERETMRIDEKGLKDYIGARAFNKVCVKKVDRKLLETAVTDPSFPLNVEGLSKFVTITTSKPFLRITEHEEVDQPDGD